MPPVTPPTILSVECLSLDDWLIVADGAAPVVWTRVGDAAVEVEDDFAEEGVVGLLGIAEYNGLPVWFWENIAALKSLGGQPPRQG